MITMTEKLPDVKKVVTSGPPGSALFSPHRKNLLSPLDMIDEFERCTQCGYCRSVCRVYNVTYNEKDYAGGRNRILKSLASKEIKFDKEAIVDSIYRCMLCGNCSVVCPVEIDTVAVFQKFRKDAIEQGVLPMKLGIMDERILDQKNPFAEKPEDRFNWTKDNPAGKAALARGEELVDAIKNGTPKKKYRVGYFVGCTSAYRNTELSTATSTILEKMGVEFVLFPSEQCCGSVLYRTGLEDHTLGLIEHNLEMIRASGVDDVVFSCSGCFSTLALEYPRLVGEDLGFNLFHIAQYIPKIAKEKGLKIRYPKYTKEDPLVVTYHDPCHLGRYMEIYDEPRELVNMIEGLKLVEMKYIKDMSHCCGAGGGVKALYGELANQVADDRLGESTNCVEILSHDRMKEAEETDAKCVVSTCVFCKNNLVQASTEGTATTGLSVLDVTEILKDCEFY